MDNKCGTWTEKDPSDVETEVLKKFLRRHKKVCPSDRAEVVRAVRTHLSKLGRTKLTIKSDPGPLATVINALGNLFKKDRAEPERVYHEPPPVFPPIPREQKQNIRYEPNPNFSPIEPVNNLRLYKTSELYSPDSLSSQQNLRVTNNSNGPNPSIFPPPPNFDFQQNAQFDQNSHRYPDSFISDAISENVRNESRGQIYASPDFNMRNNFERPTNQHVSFHPETRTPEDNLTSHLNPRAPIQPTPGPYQNLQNVQLSNHLPPSAQVSVNSGQKKFTQKFLYKFSSEKDDIAEYLSAVERFAQNLNLSDQECIFLALQNFSKVSEANLCADSLNDQERNNWTLFKTALQNKFGLTVDDYWARFESENRKESESAQTYLSRLSILYKKANEITCLSEWHQGEIVRRFRKGINPRLKSHLDAINEKSYHTIAKKCQTLERAHNIPAGFSARMLNTVSFQQVRDASNKTSENKAPQKENSDKFPRFSDQRRSTRDRPPCPICAVPGHRAEFCFFNPLGSRFKGSKWVEAQIAKSSSKN